MFENLPFFPEQASEQAAQVDALYFFLVAVSAFFALLIAVLILVFAFKYHRKHADEVGEAIHGSIPLELLWTFIPLGITMVMFVWGAQVFFHMTRPPKGAMEIYVVGKQWMWKLQHSDGARELNELHVPIGRPVKLIMASEDVIHSFFIPDFRVKADVVPGRYNTMWFTPSKPGRYHIFCTQYCGTKHSAMIGWVTAMEPADYQAWLSGGPATGTMADAGAKLFQDLTCSHVPHGKGGRARTDPEGAVRPPRPAPGRRHRDHGRRVHSRVHPEPGSEGCRGLPADHAAVPGPRDRGTAAAADCVREVGGVESVRRRGPGRAADASARTGATEVRTLWKRPHPA